MVLQSMYGWYAKIIKSDVMKASLIFVYYLLWLNTSGINWRVGSFDLGRSDDSASLPYHYRYDNAKLGGGKSNWNMA